MPTKGETGRGRVRKKVLCNVWKKRNEPPHFGGALPGVRTVLRLEGMRRG